MGVFAVFLVFAVFFAFAAFLVFAVFTAFLMFAAFWAFDMFLACVAFFVRGVFLAVYAALYHLYNPLSFISASDSSYRLCCTCWLFTQFANKPMPVVKSYFG
jgi:hypothetical protein